MEQLIAELTKRVEELTRKIDVKLVKETLSLEEAAEYLNVKKSYLYQLTHKKLIGHYKSAGGKNVYFDRKDLDNWKRTYRVNSIAEGESKAATTFLRGI